MEWVAGVGPALPMPAHSPKHVARTAAGKTSVGSVKVDRFGPQFIAKRMAPKHPNLVASEAPRRTASARAADVRHMRTKP